MIRLVLELLTIVYLIWKLREAYRHFMHGPRPPVGAGDSAPRRPAAAPEDSSLTLVRCSRCGVHVPRSRAFRSAEGGPLICDTCTQKGSDRP